MTITAEATTKALYVLDACNLNAAKQGQARVWADIIGGACPRATDEDLLAAVRRIVELRNADSKGGTWVSPGDVILMIRNARNRRAEEAESQSRQIEAPPIDPEAVRRAAEEAKAAVRAARSTPGSEPIKDKGLTARMEDA